MSDFPRFYVIKIFFVCQDGGNLHGQPIQVSSEVFSGSLRDAEALGRRRLSTIFVAEGVCYFFTVRKSRRGASLL